MKRIIISYIFPKLVEISFKHIRHPVKTRTHIECKTICFPLSCSSSRCIIFLNHRYLLTLFYRHFPALIRHGHIFIAQPPLYRIDVPASGKKRPARRLYALDEGELVAIKDRLVKEGIREDAVEVGRFKGLGEMNPDQLRETAMAPTTRRVVPVTDLPEADASTLKLFNLLMGKGEASSRRAWMEEKGHLIEADI